MAELDEDDTAVESVVELEEIEELVDGSVSETELEDRSIDEFVAEFVDKLVEESVALLVEDSVAELEDKSVDELVAEPVAEELEDKSVDEAGNELDESTALDSVVGKTVELEALESGVDDKSEKELELSDREVDEKIFEEVGETSEVADSSLDVMLNVSLDVVLDSSLDIVLDNSLVDKEVELDNELEVDDGSSLEDSVLDVLVRNPLEENALKLDDELELNVELVVVSLEDRNSLDVVDDVSLLVVNDSLDVVLDSSLDIELDRKDEISLEDIDDEISVELKVAVKLLSLDELLVGADETSLLVEEEICG
jgi:hypothetical protein